MVVWNEVIISSVNLQTQKDTQRMESSLDVNSSQISTSSRIIFGSTQQANLLVSMFAMIAALLVIEYLMNFEFNNIKKNLQKQINWKSEPKPDFQIQSSCPCKQIPEDHIKEVSPPVTYFNDETVEDVIDNEWRELLARHLPSTFEENALSDFDQFDTKQLQEYNEGGVDQIMTARRALGIKDTISRRVDHSHDEEQTSPQSQFWLWTNTASARLKSMNDGKVITELVMRHTSDHFNSFNVFQD